MFPRIYRSIVADFLLVYPSLEDAQKASDQELVSFFRNHTSGNAKMSLKRIKIIRYSVALTNDHAVIESNSLFVQSLAAQIKAINASISAYEEKIQNIYSSLPDKAIFDSLPSAAEISAPKLLCAIGTDRSRFSSSSELANYLGISPVIEASGSRKINLSL